MDSRRGGWACATDSHLKRVAGVRSRSCLVPERPGGCGSVGVWEEGLLLGVVEGGCRAGNPPHHMHMHGGWVQLEHVQSEGPDGISADPYCGTSSQLQEHRPTECSGSRLLERVSAGQAERWTFSNCHLHFSNFNSKLCYPLNAWTETPDARREMKDAVSSRTRREVPPSSYGFRF
ncbi:hypothetical protein BDV96DRAFT_259699 [Lophiotrema nucula]|uniref:Uncharacterized protein n=1 Tax=Lophiotrema nucula TaxID=690887 RepID=A0A6A5YNV4_9PLEO|nr:hypothetical protein BDV96DRAFT_259699 [Lophiotrema nucula]